MPTVHTHYVTYNRKGGRRLHAGTATDDIVAPLTNHVPQNGTYDAWAAPEIQWDDPNGHHDAKFAFWAVTGAADGAQVQTESYLNIAVGADDVQAVAWYLPQGGGGNGGPAFYIDAFDVNEGRFFDEDFVTIAPDAGLTAAANETGVVPTASAENITAVSQITGVPFADWIEFTEPAPQTIPVEEIHAAANQTTLAFAFYKSPVLAKPGKPHEYEIGTWVSFGVKVDGGGLTGHGPVPPWEPFLRELLAGLALTQAANHVSPQLRGSLNRLAAEQVALAAKQINAHMADGKAEGLEQRADRLVTAPK